MSEQKINREGFVTIAGAGPGDAELITVKLQKRLKEADVIITDRLVNPDIISDNAGKDALVLFAGKQYFQLIINQRKIIHLYYSITTTDINIVA